jgi:hypothetical protein
MYAILKTVGGKDTVFFPFRTAEDAENFIYKNNDNVLYDGKKGSWFSGENELSILFTTKMIYDEESDSSNSDSDFDYEKLN